MKRALHIFTATFLCLIIFLSITVSAKTYNVSETDIGISIDDSVWYVFTRDNIDNNPELNELKITYHTMYDILHDNNAYMDAILFYDDGGYIELFIRKNPVDSGMVNLSNYSDENVSLFAKQLAKKVNTKEFSTYKNQYKFARLEYFDAKTNYYICEFFTVVNKEIYTLTFQATADFTDAEYKEITSIVDSIHFNVDATLKEKTTSIWDNVLIKTIIGAISGAFVGGIVSLITVSVTKKKKKAIRDNTVDSTDTSSDTL